MVVVEEDEEVMEEEEKEEADPGNTVNVGVFHGMEEELR